jgi:hypothetical protein
MATESDVCNNIIPFKEQLCVYSDRPEVCGKYVYNLSSAKALSLSLSICEEDEWISSLLAEEETERVKKK